MSVRTAILIGIGLLAANLRATAQEPARPGSPVETLEQLTGEKATEPDEIETDRDSFTPASTIVGRRRLIVESAYSFEDNRGIKETHSLPELIFRYGLTDRVELRLGWNYEVGGVASETTGAESGEQGAFQGRSLIRESTLFYGMKFRVTDQDRWIPQSAVIVQTFTPTGGEETATQFITTAIAGWTLPNRWKIDAAMRYGTASEEGDHFNLWAPSAVIKVLIGEKWAAHAEYFGIFSTGKDANTTKHYFSPGMHYLVTPDLEVGFRLGWGLNDQTTRFFSNVGFGWRY